MENDLISRQAAIKDIEEWIYAFKTNSHMQSAADALYIKGTISMLPPAQPQRDIPKKPNETIDRSWGISTRQAVCPNCDAYLGMVHFICESDKKKVTYCESCGQAIDWTDWEDNDG